MRLNKFANRIILATAVLASTDLACNSSPESEVRQSYIDDIRDKVTTNSIVTEFDFEGLESVRSGGLSGNARWENTIDELILRISSGENFDFRNGIHRNNLAIVLAETILNIVTIRTQITDSDRELAQELELPVELVTNFRLNNIILSRSYIRTLGIGHFILAREYFALKLETSLNHLLFNKEPREQIVQPLQQSPEVLNNRPIQAIRQEIYATHIELRDSNAPNGIDLNRAVYQSNYFDNELFREYFRTATYNEMRSDGAIGCTRASEQCYNPEARGRRSGTQYFETQSYLDLAGLWERKVNIRSTRSTRPRNARVREFYQDFYRNQPPDTIEQVISDYQAATTDFNTSLNGSGLELGLFRDYLDENYLLVSTIKELIESSARVNPYALIHVLRALLAEGLRLPAIPAMGDNYLSFGPFQMTTIPYEGTDRMAFARHLDHFDLPENLENCTSLRSQALATLLDKAVKLDIFNQEISNNREFLRIWNSSTEVQRYTFVISLSSLAHYAPGTLYSNTRRARNIRENVFSASSLRQHNDLDEVTENLVTSLGGQLGGKVRNYVHFSRVMTPVVIEYIAEID